ncbi:MAG: hypothetical protein BWK80_26530 [Desulfobacteraceae bacterium IS3]|nr:MAG: hypothetical protein BWK80_26530 [Desulfobacteraceae bacterium IS3]
MARKLKEKILELLSGRDIEEGLEAVCEFPARQVVNPLFSFLCNSNELIKWRAVTAMGLAVSNLAENDTESARVIMRRLMWSLNDESGGIGWGAPEAMGEIMAMSGKLAAEYHSILVSYIREDGNYIEHEILQRGVLWGLGRLAYSRPELVKDAAVFLCPYMTSEDAAIRGLAAWTAGAVPAENTKPFLERLIKDQAKIIIYHERELREYNVGQIAAQSLKN